MARKTATLDVGVWWNCEPGHVHLAAPGHFITTVNAQHGSRRCHSNLYWKLARTLRDEGLPHPQLPE